MNSTTAALTHRDRAVLRAVAAGRCEISTTSNALVVDGLHFSDQFVGPRLTEAGLIAAVKGAGPARLTPSGHALLEAA
jgi:hypothetical protein